MILKGSQRGSGQELAVHLMRADENEHVELHELRGFASDNLKGAFKEVEAISRGTKCCQYLFSLSLNPPPAENVSVATFENTIDRIEDRLGLNGQPRAVVFHEKNGRRHAHVAWSRIDAEKMTARQMSYFKTALREMSRDLYIENGWKMPAGLANTQDRDPANFTLSEWQQAKRAKTDPKLVKAAFQDSWAISDSGKAFEKALGERGYFLARGDRRGCVAVDWRGEVYSVARQVGLRTKEVNARIGDSDRLKPVADVREAIQSRMDQKIRGWIDQVQTENAERRDKLHAEKTQIVAGQRRAREELKAHQQQRTDSETKARAARLPRGLKGLWSRLTGEYRQIRKLNERQALEGQKRDRIEVDQLIRDQLDERRELHEREAELRTKETRDLRELNRAIGMRLGSDDKTHNTRKSDRETDRIRGGGRERTFDPS